MKLANLLAKYGRQSLGFFGNVEGFLAEGRRFPSFKEYGQLNSLALSALPNRLKLRLGFF